ncbi:hypothetical protein UMZ34_18395 [Halopseudomonas pachastrellae]|nr:hypothetical protein UMZ34_18395 [Halopseudomonas pachastrellae]
MDGPPPDDSGMGERDEDELDVAQYIDDWQLPDAEEQAAAEEAQDAISDLPPAVAWRPNGWCCSNAWGLPV